MRITTEECGEQLVVARSKSVVRRLAIAGGLTVIAVEIVDPIPIEPAKSAIDSQEQRGKYGTK